MSNDTGWHMIGFWEVPRRHYRFFMCNISRRVRATCKPRGALIQKTVLLDLDLERLGVIGSLTSWFTLKKKPAPGKNPSLLVLPWERKQWMSSRGNGWRRRRQTNASGPKYTLFFFCRNCIRSWAAWISRRHRKRTHRPQWRHRLKCKCQQQQPPVRPRRRHRKWWCHPWCIITIIPCIIIHSTANRLPTLGLQWLLCHLRPRTRTRLVYPLFVRDVDSASRTNFIWVPWTSSGTLPASSAPNAESN